MFDKKKILDNFQFSEVNANYFVLDKDEQTNLYGWIALDESFNDFLSLLRDEMEYSWGKEYSNLKEYNFYYIDLENKYNLVEINTDEIYKQTRKLKEIYLAILHKDIKSKIVQNIPLLYEWFMGISSKY
jgi:hypothetical protein